MRLLVGSDHYPPFIGGAHTQTRLLAHELARRGHDVAVATPWSRNLAETEQEEGVSIHRVRQLRTIATSRVPEGVQQHQPPFADPVSVRALRRIIREFRPDVVHSHGWIGHSFAAALVGHPAPLVLSSRDYGYACPKRTLLHHGHPCSGPAPLKCGACAGAYYGQPKGWIATAGVLPSRAPLRRRTRAVHSVSTYVRDAVRRDFLRDRASGVLEVVIPEAVPAPGPVTAGVAAQLDRLPADPFMLFVGALRTEKGIPELLAAYQLLSEPPPLVLIGTLERDTPAAFPPGVEVLTDFSHDAVLHAWDRALFGVFPSVLPEPMGTVVCEAVSRGAAVIGTRPGGHEDVIEDGATGLLVEQGSVPALATAMQRLLEDHALRSRLGESARAAAGRFALENVVTQFEALYQDAMRAL